MAKRKLKAKRILLTGASSGIGYALAQQLVAKGNEILVVARREQRLSSLQEATKECAGTIHCLAGDITCGDFRTEIFQWVETYWDSTLDVLINNAGIAHVGNVLTTTEEDFDRVLSVNVKGVYNCLQAGVGHMQSTGGAIVNIASTVSVMAIDDRFAYSASKGAVLAMTYAVARDFLKAKIRCNAILPARIHTPFVDGFIAKNYPDNVDEMFKKLSEAQPIGRMGQPDEVAAMAVFLCSDEASFITGCPYPVDGGTLNIR